MRQKSLKRINWLGVSIKGSLPSIKGEFMFKVIIAGGRDFDDYEIMRDKCRILLTNKEDVVIVSGTANGADKLGEVFAVYHEYEVERYPANWDLHGKSAGYIRNSEMADVASALIAFWDGVSRGTKHMIDLARKKGLLVRIIKYTKIMINDKEHKIILKE